MNHDTFHEMLKAVDEFPRAIGSYMDRSGAAPGVFAPGSLAALELAQHGYERGIRNIYSQASMLYEAAGDYLGSIPRLLSEPMLIIAPHSAARNVLEASASLAWLVDSSISGQERLSRSMALRYKNLTEEAKIANAARSKEHIDSIAAHAEGVAAEALSMRIEVRRSNGRLKGIGVVIPEATRLVATYFDAEVYFRFLSGITHSLGSIVVSSSFREVAPEAFERFIDVKTFYLLLLRPALWFGKSVLEFIEFFGWKSEDLLVLFDESFSPFKILESERFWRP